MIYGASARRKLRGNWKRKKIGKEFRRKESLIWSKIKEKSKKKMVFNSRVYKCITNKGLISKDLTKNWKLSSKAKACN